MVPFLGNQFIEVQRKVQSFLLRKKWRWRPPRMNFILYRRTFPFSFLGNRFPLELINLVSYSNLNCIKVTLIKRILRKKIDDLFFNESTESLRVFTADTKFVSKSHENLVFQIFSLFEFLNCNGWFRFIRNLWFQSILHIWFCVWNLNIF